MFMNYNKIIKSIKISNFVKIWNLNIFKKKLYLFILDFKNNFITCCTQFSKMLTQWI